MAKLTLAGAGQVLTADGLRYVFTHIIASRSSSQEFITHNGTFMRSNVIPGAQSGLEANQKPIAIIPNVSQSAFRLDNHTIQFLSMISWGVLGGQEIKGIWLGKENIGGSFAVEAIIPVNSIATEESVYYIKKLDISVVGV